MIEKHAAICLILMLLLVGCAREPKTEETDLRGNGNASQQVSSVDWNQSAQISSFLETPDGYYYVGEAVNSQEDGLQMVYFCPKGGDKFVPLCGKPNCKHNDENCNACVGLGCSLGYYDGALYDLDMDISTFSLPIIKINPDGSDHRVVGKIDWGKYPHSRFSYVFHRGKLIVNLCARSELPLEEQVDHLIVVDLADGSQKELADSYIRRARTTRTITSCFQDKLYGFGDGKNNQNYASKDERLIEIDAVTGEVRTLLSGPISGFYRTESAIDYVVPKEYETDTWPAGFHSYDLKSGTVQDYDQPVADIYCACWDEDYIYAFSEFRDESYTERTVYFLSRDFKLLGQLEEKAGLSYICATSDRVFFGDLLLNQIYYIDKVDIGRGAISLTAVPSPNGG